MPFATTLVIMVVWKTGVRIRSDRIRNNSKQRGLRFQRYNLLETERIFISHFTQTLGNRHGQSIVFQFRHRSTRQINQIAGRWLLDQSFQSSLVRFTQLNEFRNTIAREVNVGECRKGGTQSPLVDLLQIRLIHTFLCRLHGPVRHGLDLLDQTVLQHRRLAALTANTHSDTGVVIFGLFALPAKHVRIDDRVCIHGLGGGGSGRKRVRRGGGDCCCGKDPAR